jgi:peptidoglycan/xylan/chitin deacetylase (PgdA/CDA1 family)
MQSMWGSLSKKAVILLYHRVFESSSDPQLLCVSPSRFESHLKHLRKYYNPISLTDLSQALGEGRLPKRAVVVTFDDGYWDNYAFAKPLLERYEIPATIFVTSDYVGRQCEFWWDEIERLLLASPCRLAHIELKVNGIEREWELLPPNAGLTSPALYPQWNVLATADPTPLHSAYRDLQRFLRSLPSSQREQALVQMREQLEDDGTARPGYRPLSPEEVQNFVSGSLFEIGAHSASHVVLSLQSESSQKAEIMSSRQQLESLVGRQLYSFSYPFGGKEDIGSQAPALVEMAGYQVACANYPAAVTVSAERFVLPRYIVRDWNEEEFAHRLNSWFAS